MIVATKAIVLSAIKYRDKDLIVKCFTEKEGVKSYIIYGVRSAKSKKIKVAHFQPLTQLSIVANHNTKGALNTIKEVALVNHYSTIYSDIYKQSIAFFLSELLNYSIQEEEENTALYTYLEVSLLWFDSHDEYANFHLLFILNLTKYLGFYPEIENKQYKYFDLLEGQYTNNLPKYHFIKDINLIEFNKLLGINFDALKSIAFSSQTRRHVLAVLIQYYELHLSGFKKPKSLEVLKTLFN